MDLPFLIAGSSPYMVRPTMRAIVRMHLERVARELDSNIQSLDEDNVIAASDALYGTAHTVAGVEFRMRDVVNRTAEIKSWGQLLRAQLVNMRQLLEHIDNHDDEATMRLLSERRNSLTREQLDNSPLWSALVSYYGENDARRIWQAELEFLDLCIRLFQIAALPVV